MLASKAKYWSGCHTSYLIHHSPDCVPNSYDDGYPVGDAFNQHVEGVHNTMIVSRTMTVPNVNEFVEFCVVCQYDVKKTQNETPH